MTVLQAVVLGLVQGLTEFLPLSSSGHLVLLQNIFKIEAPALLFDTFLHLGTMVAVIIVLRKEIWALLTKPFQRLTGLLILATLPAVVAALFFKDVIEDFFASGASLGWGFLMTAAILVIAERLAARPGVKRSESTMSWLDAMVIGLLQALAILPAVSRSGSTIAAALSRKLDRDFAARFSFLLSIPAIFGAFVFQLKDLASLPAAASLTDAVSGGGLSASSIGWLAIIVGTVVSIIVGILAVTFMLRLINRGKLYGFAIYVGLLGAVVLLDQHLTHFVF